MAFVPHNAPVMALAFLGTCGLLGLAGLAVIWSLGAGRVVRAVQIAGAGAVVVLLYGGAWLLGARSSVDRALAPGERKYFCEMDCHLAYNVESVTRTRTLGDGDAAVVAEGVFWVVTLRTWFDERTISSRRPRCMPLRPGPRRVRLVDAAGRMWSTTLAGQRADRGSSVPLTQELRPGEWYETRLVFDVPADVESARLLLTDAFPLSALLIGHENVPGAGRIYFSLDVGRVAGS
ncbi:MAG: hypothetical protein L0271_16570 [Gemmatimonadetes bacterium]|nr:hypothetical protein [Gemmatimonadota bacterium]